MTAFVKPPWINRNDRFKKLVADLRDEIIGILLYQE